MKLAEKYINGLKNAYVRCNGKKIWGNFESVAQGANPKDLEKLKSIYPDIPQTLLDLLLHVDGTYYREYPAGNVLFYFFGSDVDDGEYPYYMLSATQMSECTEFCADYVDREFDDVYVDDKIIDCSDKMHWLNFSDCMNNGGTSQLYIDFSPSCKGNKGQIVRFLHDPDEIKVIADSFDAYLQMLIDNDFNFINEISILAVD